MSNANEKLRPQEGIPAPGSAPDAAGGPGASQADANGAPPPGNRGGSPVPEDLGDDPRAALRQRLAESHLPPDLKARILADQPPQEQLERLYRELQENGGLSAEQFMACLGREVEPRP